MANLSSLEKEIIEIDSLKEGKSVTCKKCNKGHYYPFNCTDPSKAHSFVCDNCGDTVRFEPVVDFDWRH